MKELILQAYELLSGIVPLLLVLVLLLRFGKKSQTKITKSLFFLAVFALYIIFVLSVTGAGTIYDLKYFDFSRQAINFIPFPKGFDPMEHILNVILFIPLGVMLGLLWKRKGYLIQAFLYGFGFSFLIECSQLLNNRSSDIDDLILNTLGAVLGYLILLPFLKRQNKFTGKIPQSVILIPLSVILIIFLGRFFLYNELYFVKILYGF
jgi:glycopeptide antibiotics resistance protein